MSTHHNSTFKNVWRPLGEGVFYSMFLNEITHLILENVMGVKKLACLTWHILGKLALFPNSSFELIVGV